LIHGYDYKFIRAPDYPDRWATWVKVPMMKEALKTHDIVVFMDADAMFHYPHLPLEWLLNYWNMTAATLVAMALDPNNKARNSDSQGNILLNTGFVIAQQSNRTQEMFRAWDECPQDTRYANCSHWASEWAHEQAAFGNHIRYDFNRPDDIKILPCTEANGCPEAIDHGCTGEFVRHFWIDKQLTMGALQDSIEQYFVRRLLDQFQQDRLDLVIDATDKKFPITAEDLNLR
jgi:hypothetical protein